MILPPSSAGGPVVSGLFRHPVKGLAAVPVERLELDRVGPVGDRRWMVVTPGGEDFLTQRSHPRMVRLRADVVDGGLRLESPDREPLDVREPPPDAPRLRVPVWADRVEAAVASDEAARWLTDALGQAVRLVRLPDDVVRPLDPARARAGFAGRVAFADGYPLLLVSEASVAEIDRRTPPGSPRIGVERFRPNVVVAGTEPWEEDGWRLVRAGGVELAVVKPCARCAVTTVDPATGRKGPEPLRTLARFRRAEGKVWVGQNAVHRGPGVLGVGDPVTVVESGPRRPADGLAETLSGPDE